MKAPKFLIIRQVKTKRLVGASCETIYLPANSDEEILQIYVNQHSGSPTEVYLIGEIYKTHSEIHEMNLKKRDEQEYQAFLRLKEKYEPK